MTKSVQIVNRSNMDECVTVIHVGGYRDRTVEVLPGNSEHVYQGVAVVIPGTHAPDVKPMLNAEGRRTHPEVYVRWSDGPPVRDDA